MWKLEESQRSISTGNPLLLESFREVIKRVTGVPRRPSIQALMDCFKIYVTTERDLSPAVCHPVFCRQWTRYQTADQPNLFMPGEFLTHSKWRDAHILGVLLLRCGSSTTWCQSLLKYVPGQLIPKAMYARHRKLDKSALYLEGPSWELQSNVDLTIKHSFVESSSEPNDEEPNEMNPQTTFDIDIDDRCDHPTSLRLKDETTALENALHDLMYLCSAVTQQIMSFSYDLNLVFESQPTEPDRSPYQLYSSIPPGPNMGHERRLYEVLVNLRHVEQFPSLDASRLQFLAMLEDELRRIDAIRQAAWNGLLRRGVDPNSGQIQGLVTQNCNNERNEDDNQSKRGTPSKGSYVIVNTGM
ncbi:hypothetical protein EDD17DRAFT_1517395 [Pisolithus thermaeus]|nr:hypothetical protein EDD17DRAFT_1517395 [Pisolithus thermaeus]